MGNKKEFILMLLYASTFTTVLCAPSVPPVTSTESLVVISSTTQEVTTEKNVSATTKSPKTRVPPKIYAMKVETNVTNRFAKTLVTSKVKNLDDHSQEATFAVVLPETAYISGFIMEIDGKKYEAYIKEKEEAKKIYNNAVASGLGAAHVEANARDSNRFTVSVNIEPQSKATFYLTYEELLKRQNGAYDIVLNLHPGQPVKDLAVEVNINETRPLAFVRAPSLRSGNEISKNDEKLDPKAIINTLNKTAASVIFKPDLDRQKELGTHLGNKEGTGLAGQFVVQYDVERDPNGGEVLVSDGYFVHFFAPSDLKPLQKHVVFVLDTSGSMSGTRIQQLKLAMKSILGQLDKNDSLNIIDFNSIVNVWNIPKVEVQYVEGELYDDFYGDTAAPPKDRKNQTLPGAYEVNEENIKYAEKVIEKLDAYGGTDIKSSLVVALQLLNKTKDQRENTKQPIVIFLTDGEATIGEYGDEAINSVTSANTDGVPIFCISFGDGADRQFLEKLALKNQGFARHIYEAADASLQLEEFYKYISSPLLTKVNFKYVSKAVSKLTNTQFPIMFHGTEIVVAGEVDPNFAQELPSPAPETSSPANTSGSTTEKPIIIDEGGLTGESLIPEIDSWGADGKVNFKPKVEEAVGSLEKHWAYLTLKQLLEERDAAENKTQYTKQALDLALKYSFVTPVSSLVVVKPNDTKTEANPEDASKGHDDFDSFAYESAAVPGAVPFHSIGVMPLSGIADYSFNLQQPIPLALDEDRLYNQKSGGSYMSTPAGYSVFHTTTKVASSPSVSLVVGGSSTEAPKENSIIESLKQKLPWLNDVLDKNETLTLPNGKYQLGISDTVGNNPECPSTPLNGTGTCTLIKDCPEVYSLVTDVKIYLEHFCQLQEFAGICCPKKKETTT